MTTQHSVPDTAMPTPVADILTSIGINPLEWSSDWVDLMAMVNDIEAGLAPTCITDFKERAEAFHPHEIAILYGVSAHVGLTEGG